MNRGVSLAAATAALLVGISACSGASDDAAETPAAPAAVEPTRDSDPYAWVPVAYEDYRLAAAQMGLRPDLMSPQAGFSSGLAELCHTSPEDLAEMRRAQLSNTAQAETYSAAEFLADEVALRLGLACPQRMSDWIEADHAETAQSEAGEIGEAVSLEPDEDDEVSDEELAEAAAEETAEQAAEQTVEEGDADTGDTSTEGETEPGGTADAAPEDAADADASATG